MAATRLAIRLDVLAQAELPAFPPYARPALCTATSDAELLECWVGGGDRDAGNKLILRYLGRVRRFFARKVHPTDVEDLVQRTFKGCIESVIRFRAEASFETYIFSIARRQLYRYIRDAARDAGRSASGEGVSSLQALESSPSSALAEREVGELVSVALASLPADAQSLLEFYYWEGLAGPELARVLDIRPGAVRTRLHRARAALRDALVAVTRPPSALPDLEHAARALGVRV